MRKGELSGSWLETELARQLRPVSAPDSLWYRIHEQRRPLRVRPNPWTAWSIAGAALLMLLLGLVWRLGATRDPAADLESLAGRELRNVSNGAETLGIRSSDPAEIRRWMKARLHVDVTLADQPGNPAVQLLGARILRFDRFSAGLISYRVGNDFAVMLVSDGPSAGPGHKSPRTASSGDMRLYSWNQGANSYAIAFGNATESKGPCLLCHAEPPAVMVFR